METLPIGIVVAKTSQVEELLLNGFIYDRIDKEKLSLSKQTRRKTGIEPIISKTTHRYVTIEMATPPICLLT